MGYEATLQRINDIRAMTGAASANAAASIQTPVNTDDAALFNSQLAAAQQATQLELSPENPLSAMGLPILSVADQYRAMGIPIPQAASLSGLSAVGSVNSLSYLNQINGNGSVGERIVALAQGEVGQAEIGSSNESPRIREYRKATLGAENTPGPWCAYFVSWLAKESGAPVGAQGNGTGYVPTLEAWGKQENRFFTKETQTPQPGDVVIFNWGGQGPSDHTGIVERVDEEGNIHTIEGNSSDAVRRRRYSGTSGDITGYIRLG